VLSLIAFALASALAGPADADLYRYKADEQTRWASPENRSAAKGAGGQENKGAKGHAWDRMQPGEAYVLADVQGAGTIARPRVTGPASVCLGGTRTFAKQLSRAAALNRFASVPKG